MLQAGMAGEQQQEQVPAGSPLPAASHCKKPGALSFLPFWTYFFPFSFFPRCSLGFSPWLCSTRCVFPHEHLLGQEMFLVLGSAGDPSGAKSGV